jgi:hypothetical protein
MKIISYTELNKLAEANLEFSFPFENLGPNWMKITPSSTFIFLLQRIPWILDYRLKVFC